jgi:hypothetical protein
MNIRFASWNVNNRNLTPKHISFLRDIGADLMAFQEVSPRFHSALVKAKVFDWSAYSLSNDSAAPVRARSRRLGCSVFGSGRFEFISASSLEAIVFPERTLMVRLRSLGGDLTAFSIHIPPGASWGTVKPKTMEAIGQWFAKLDGVGVVGIDANSPKTDHPDISKNTWWWNGEPSLLGGEPVHHLRDAFRSYLHDHPEELAAITHLHPNGPLAVSHVRGKNLCRTECRYDFIFCTPETVVDSISYMYAESLAAGSDHALVVATLRLPETRVAPPVVAA